MKFNNIVDIQKAFMEIKEHKTGRNTHYPVLFKKALCEYIAEQNISPLRIAENIPVSNQSIYTWIQQYNDGLYTLEGAYNVSKKSKKINCSILDKLKQEKEIIERKINLIKEAESLGLTVS